MITVVTPTLNAANSVRALAESLCRQSVNSFSWLVLDGESSDDTLQIIESYMSRISVQIYSAADKGIYDALNRAIDLVSTPYYLVVGADDFLFDDAIKNYETRIRDKGADLISAAIMTDHGLVCKRIPSVVTINGAFSKLSGHSVGTLIRRDLHEEYGYYPIKFRITADQAFLLRAILGGCSVDNVDFMAGFYNCQSGYSGRNRLQVIVEEFLMRSEMLRSEPVQKLLFMARVMKFLLGRGL